VNLTVGGLTFPQDAVREPTFSDQRHEERGENNRLVLALESVVRHPLGTKAARPAALNDNHT